MATDENLVAFMAHLVSVSVREPRTIFLLSTHIAWNTGYANKIAYQQRCQSCQRKTQESKKGVMGKAKRIGARLLWRFTIRRECLKASSHASEEDEKTLCCIHSYCRSGLVQIRRSQPSHVVNS